MKNEKRLKELLTQLVGIPTVGGFSKKNAQAVADVCRKFTDFFDEISVLDDASILLRHSCTKKDPKKLLVDAHIDTVGFVVSEILDDGFLRVMNVGGVDSTLLPASRVEIYGKKTIDGVFTSIPPHLSKDDGIAAELHDILIDTGLSKDELIKNVRIGTLVGFSSKPEFCADTVFSKSLDNKISVSAALIGLDELKNECPDDVAVDLVLSSGEETGGVGVYSAHDSFSADAAIVMDTNFAKEEGVPDHECYTAGSGAGVSYSASTDRAFTEYLLSTAKKHRICCSSVVETKNTGTNATALQINGLGIPCAVLSVPIRHMHTPYEFAKLSDALCAASVVEYAVHDFSKKTFGRRYVKRCDK